MSQILLVSNEPGTSNILIRLFKTEGYKVASAGDLARGRELIESEQFSLMICSAGKGWDPDLDLLKLARAQQPAMPVIVIAESDGGETVTRVSELKPFACLEKPLKVDELLATVQKAIDYSDAALAERVDLNLQLETCYQFENIVAESPAMKRVCDMVSRIAGTDVTVLISGEGGTGKIAIARAIHNHSRRQSKNFVTVECGEGNNSVEAELFGETGQEGALERANGGTLFLRKIGGLQMAVQENLFHALRERNVARPGAKKGVTVDVRVIASTSRDLEHVIEQGSFSNDLYKFLKVIFIEIPPLRERPQDIMPTVQLLLRQKLGGDKVLPSLESGVSRILEEYSWPGNVSEMEEVLEQALKAAEGNKITKESLPAELVSRISPPSAGQA